MDNKYEEAINILSKYNQKHLLAFYNELSEEQKEELVNQILNLNFELVTSLYENRNNNNVSIEYSIKPIEYEVKEDIEKELKEKYIEIGKKAIKDGEYALCMMAGGQGTRLGHNGPKGTFLLNTNPQMSIFELLINDIKEKCKEYNTELFVYIMTSEENNDDTVNFFETNNYFGYNKNKVIFFRQGKLPMVDTNGKILLDKKYLIKEASDGNGGIFESLYRNNIIEHMQDNNIKYLEVKNIDNILFNICDEIAIGMLINSNVDLLSKSVVKAYPEEKVGVFCKKNDKLGVIEYMEMPEELRYKRDENGELYYGESYFGSNIFKVSKLNEIANEKLQYHTALKKASFISEDGDEIKTDKPNAFKFETFIFDAFAKVDKYKILRVKREEEFAPVKNAEGVDSPETALKLYNNKYGNR